MRRSHIFASGLCLSILLLLFMPPQTLLADIQVTELPPPAEQEIDFETDIRSIFDSSCIACHGPHQQQGGFRLDRKTAALRGGGTGRSILPGDSEESRLIQMVAGIDPLFMPAQGKALTTEEISLLRAWIDQGADWPVEDEEDIDDSPVRSNHWAFQPRVQPELPEVSNPEWVKNPIDAFVLAQLDSHEIKPSPRADRETLIRRLSLDLLGLLPTPEETRAFVNDPRPDAYERLVDRLLASPHFGERWGRHWLDQARYADSDGYEKDLPRPYAYTYRDWVIDAINRDLPYDQFTIEQLAGDLLPDPTLEQKIATGFHRQTLTNREGGVDEEEFRVAAVKDRVNTTSSVWLGLTVACAECHNHKYDPITQREYYGMYAFFNQAQEEDIPAPRPDELAVYENEKARYDAVREQLQASVKTYEREQFPQRLQNWIDSVQPPQEEWSILRPIAAESAEGATMEIQEDGSIYVSGRNPGTDVYTLTFRTEQPNITALQLETLLDERLPRGGASRASHGNFVVSIFRAEANPPESSASSQPIEFARATADYEQNNYPAMNAIDGDTGTGWAIGSQENKAHRAVFEASHPIGVEGETELTIVIEQKHGRNHNLGRFRILAAADEPPINASGMSYDVALALKKPSEERTAEDKMFLAEHYKDIDSIYLSLIAALDEHQNTNPSYPPTQAMVLAENPKPPESRIHLRGDFLSPGDSVEPHTLAVLPSLDARNDSPDRLDLAQWIVDPENPLTSRVAANNNWQHLFGAGLVPTPDDYGLQGEPPSHPELLDWLAERFIELKWSRKAFIKTIVMSNTYQQVSHSRHDLMEIDPENRLLARQNRYRLEAEIIRDISLQVSGLLHDAIGGPSVRPPLPQDIAELGYAGSVRWPESPAPDKYRRGMYIFFQRTVPYPMLATFDCPESTVTLARRERSNTPLQALTLLNDPVFFECAQAFGHRILTDLEGDTKVRIHEAFHAAISRAPHESEFLRLGQLFNRVFQQGFRDPRGARSLLFTDPPENTNPAEAAAWVGVARALLNLDEFFNRE